MSRPKPTILLSHTSNTTYKQEQVLDADAIFAVFYRGKPVNLRIMSSLIDYPSAKYKKSSFSNAGHAFNLAERLNTLFHTDEFEVFRLTAGEKISEEDL